VRTSPPEKHLRASMGMIHTPQYDFLVSPAVLYGLPAAYVVAAIAGNFAMRSRKAVEVGPAMKLYNVAQIVLCTYMTIGMLPALGFPNIFGINGKYTEAGEWFIFVHYLSKFMDWFDTLWMVLKKKSHIQMSFLHVYHHATIGVVWGFLLSTGNGNGTAQYGAFINSVTHVIMYTHFLWTSFGLKNPFKNLVTTWQITQFYSCFLHSLCVLLIQVDGAPMEQQLPRKYAWLQFGYHLTMIYLFTFKLHWVPKFLKDPALAVKEKDKKKM